MRKERIDFLLKISKEFIKIKNFDQLINKVLKTVKEDFGLANSALLLYDKEKNEIYLKSFIGFQKKDVEGIRIPVGKGITGKCAKKKMTIYVPDVSEEPSYIKRHFPAKSELAIPILSKKRLLGVLNFEKKEIDGFGAEEIALLKTFSSITSMALENVLQFEDIRKKDKEKIELIEIAKMASGPMRKETLFGKLVSLGGKLIGAEKCTIALFNKRTGEVQAQLPGYGVSEEHLKKLHFSLQGKSIGAKVIRSGEIYMTNKADKDPVIIKKFAKLFGVKRLIVSPLKTSKEVIGVFYAAKGKGSVPFTEDEKNVTVIFSSLAAPIIKKMQILEELREKKEQLEETSKDLKRVNEELQNISFAKTNLISNISHELRTPLVSIKGYTDLVLEGRFGNLNDKQKLSLDAVKRNAERLLNVIDNLIDISTIELEVPQKIEKELINIPSLLDETIRIVFPKTEEKGIKIIKKSNLDYLIVEAQKEKLLRAFLNIMDNAVKFNKKNGKIFVKCYKDDKSVITEIKDTGIGIPEKYHKMIFNRFFQIESSDKRVYKGAGIGLSLSLEIIRFFDGDIKVKSIPKKGSTFIVTLPAM